MTLKNLTQALSATLVILSAASIALAQPTSTTPDTGKWHGKSAAEWQAKRNEMHQKFAQELGLSAEQQSKIDALRQNFRNAHKADFEAMRAQHQELKTMQQNGASKEQIDAKRQAMHQQFAGLKADKEKLSQQIRAVLTPEQAKKFDAMKAQHREHRHCDGHKGAKGGKQPS